MFNVFSSNQNIPLNDRIALLETNNIANNNEIEKMNVLLETYKNEIEEMKNTLKFYKNEIDNLQNREQQFKNEINCLNSKVNKIEQTNEEKHAKLIQDIKDSLDYINKQPSIFHGYVGSGSCSSYTAIELSKKYFPEYLKTTYNNNSECVTLIGSCSWSSNISVGHHHTYGGGGYCLEICDYFDDRKKVDTLENEKSYKFDITKFVIKYLKTMKRCGGFNRIDVRTHTSYVGKLISHFVLCQLILNDKIIIPTYPNETEIEYEIRILEKIKIALENGISNMDVHINFNGNLNEYNI